MKISVTINNPKDYDRIRNVFNTYPDVLVLRRKSGTLECSGSDSDIEDLKAYLSKANTIDPIQVRESINSNTIDEAIEKAVRGGNISNLVSSMTESRSVFTPVEGGEYRWDNPPKEAYGTNVAIPVSSGPRGGLDTVESIFYIRAADEDNPKKDQFVVQLDTDRGAVFTKQVKSMEEAKALAEEIASSEEFDAERYKFNLI